MPGGDYGVGYAWSLLVLMAFFWICLALVAAVIAWGGGFAWLSLGRFAGGGMLVLGFLVMLLGSNLGVSRGLRIFQLLTPINAVATPLVLMLAFAVLLNDPVKAITSPNLIKWDLGSVFALNSLVLVMMVLSPFVLRLGRLLSM